MGRYREIVDSLPVLSKVLSEEFLIEIVTKRFEYTYEAAWKVAKEFLKVRGIECFSPKSCFADLIKEGVISEKWEGQLYELVKCRNLLVHVYDSNMAKEIFNRIANENVLALFEDMLRGLRTLE